MPQAGFSFLTYELVQEQLEKRSKALSRKMNYDDNEEEKNDVVVFADVAEKTDSKKKNWLKRPRELWDLLDTNSTNKRTRQQSLYLEILLIVRTSIPKKNERGGTKEKKVWRIESTFLLTSTVTKKHS